MRPEPGSHSTALLRAGADRQDRRQGRRRRQGQLVVVWLNVNEARDRPMAALARFRPSCVGAEIERLAAALLLQSGAEPQGSLSRPRKVPLSAVRAAPWW